jgi:hypothetical protein
MFCFKKYRCAKNTLLELKEVPSSKPYKNITSKSIVYKYREGKVKDTRYERAG